jgi:hypothetical protein
VTHMIYTNDDSVHGDESRKIFITLGRCRSYRFAVTLYRVGYPHIHEHNLTSTSSFRGEARFALVPIHYVDLWEFELSMHYIK